LTAFIQVKDVRFQKLFALCGVFVLIAIMPLSSLAYYGMGDEGWTRDCDFNPSTGRYESSTCGTWTTVDIGSYLSTAGISDAEANKLVHFSVEPYENSSTTPLGLVTIIGKDAISAWHCVSSNLTGLDCAAFSPKISLTSVNTGSASGRYTTIDGFFLPGYTEIVRYMKRSNGRSIFKGICSIDQDMVPPLSYTTASVCPDGQATFPDGWETQQWTTLTYDQWDYTEQMFASSSSQLFTPDSGVTYVRRQSVLAYDGQNLWTKKCEYDPTTHTTGDSYQGTPGTLCGADAWGERDLGQQDFDGDSIADGARASSYSAWIIDDGGSSTGYTLREFVVKKDFMADIDRNLDVNMTDYAEFVADYLAYKDDIANYTEVSDLNLDEALSMKDYALFIIEYLLTKDE